LEKKKREGIGGRPLPRKTTPTVVENLARRWYILYLERRSFSH
jgi:hypothetical protein